MFRKQWINVIPNASYCLTKDFLKILYKRKTTRHLSTAYNDSLIPVKMSFTSYETAHPADVLSSTAAEPLLIMHGLFGSKNNWNSLSKALHTRCKKKIIAVDARNHGDSPHSTDFSYKHIATDILYLLKELDVKKVDILGHSMGGRAAMVFALMYPELVGKLIVVDISPVNRSAGMVKMNTYFDALKSVKLHKNLTMSQARKSADDQLSYWIPDIAIRQFLLTNLTQMDGGRFKWRINLSALSSQFEGQIMTFPEMNTVCNKPALFLGGLKSDYLRFEDHESIKKIFPLAEFQYIDAGHWLHSERPNEFISIVSDFLSRNTAI